MMSCGITGDGSLQQAPTDGMQWQCRLHTITANPPNPPRRVRRILPHRHLQPGSDGLGTDPPKPLHEGSDPVLPLGLALLQCNLLPGTLSKDDKEKAPCDTGDMKLS